MKPANFILLKCLITVTDDRTRMSKKCLFSLGQPWEFKLSFSGNSNSSVFHCFVERIRKEEVNLSCEWVVFDVRGNGECGTNYLKCAKGMSWIEFFPAVVNGNESHCFCSIESNAANRYGAKPSKSSNTPSCASYRFKSCGNNIHIGKPNCIESLGTKH